MKALLFRSLAGLGAALTLAVCLSIAADPPAADQPPIDDRHDFVFLGEARPVLIRMHVRVDGKPVQAAVDDFMKNLFTYLDINGDNVLSKAEAERAPALDQLLSGGIAQGIGGFGGGKAAATPSFEEMDADKDGKVTLAELSAYYHKQGYLPVQLQAESKQSNPLAGIYGGKRAEPTVEAVSEAIFALLDTNKDGKLTREELAAAPSILLQRDENDDEMVTTLEIAAPPKSNANMLAMGMGMGGNAGSLKSTKNLVLVSRLGEVPADLVRRLQAFYGAVPENDEEKKLSRTDLGLDEATFAGLDVNKDGVLDGKELAGFVKRPPDVEMVVRVGSTDGAARVELTTAKTSPLAGNAHMKSGLARLDLGRTRLDLVANTEYQANRFGGILRDQILAQFKQADKANKGYLEEKSIKGGNRFFAGLFKTMDRDGDGKLYESEVIAYFDQMAELQRRARLACVTLVLTNQSRGLFDALDVDRDGRLSVREMRGAVKLLDQLETQKKGFLVKADLPHSYQLALRRGPASTGGLGGAAAFFDLYSSTGAGDGLPALTAGPLWFRKMDRNRDGDVSRKEFLGTDEQFRQIDVDGDGLISVEEADRYDAASRKLRQ
jgi:Ca2+-binding EF-hand superfamily protein